MSSADEQAREPLGMNAFKVLKAPSSHIGPRLGRLALPRRNIFDTPHHVGITSRGAVPHLAQDTLRARTNLKGLYMGLEDFVEKAPQKTPPVLLQPVDDGASRLRAFTALPDDYLVVLGLRRMPPVQTPSGNTKTAAAICTAVGFSHYPLNDYIEATRKLSPDIVVAPGDIPYNEKPGSRRIEKMSGLTEKWVKEMLEEFARDYDDDHSPPQIFAPILPIESEMQSYYLDMLTEEANQTPLAGVALFSADSVESIPGPLTSLPRLSLSNADSPHHLLREISLGIDIFAATFINAATDAGIALDFCFPPPTTPTPTPKPLGIDIWHATHSTSLTPLSSTPCTCHTCTLHHRAYIQHLLQAKEMLAWTLLQIHNIHIVDEFFAGVRQSIASDVFERDMNAFMQAYERDMPEKTGRGPRVRGYQFKSEGGAEAKKNEVAYRMLDGKGEGVEEAAADGDIGGLSVEEMEQNGLAEKEEQDRIQS